MCSIVPVVLALTLTAMWWVWWVALGLVWLAILRKVIWRNTYLAGIDSTLATADVDGFRTTIHSVFTLQQNVTEQAFRELLETKYLHHRRLKQRLRLRSWLWHYWEDVGDAFRLEHHFTVVTLPPNGDSHAQLEQYVSKQLTTPLHPDRPLWQWVLFRDFGPQRNQSVVLYRVHHSIGDGIALMRIALTVFDSKTPPALKVGANASVSAAAATEPQSPPILPPSPSPTLLSSMQQSPSPASAPTSPAVPATTLAARSGVNSSADGKAAPSLSKPKPKAHPKRRVNYCKLALGVFSSVVKLLVLPADPVSPLKHSDKMQPDTAINARWSRTPIPLRTLKAISKQTGTSINDILTSCGSGAISSYLARRHATANADMDVTKSSRAAVAASGVSKLVADIQAVLWVSLRGLDLTVRRVDFSNKLGTVYLKLPLTVADPVARLKVVQQQTARLIASPEAYVSYAIMSVIGFLPPVLCRLIWYSSAFKVTLSMSNLPGPSQPLQFAGGDVERFIFFVPPTRTIGHFLCILSYAESVVCGLACDERLVEDPTALVQCFHDEVDALKAATGITD